MRKAQFDRAEADALEKGENAEEAAAKVQELQNASNIACSNGDCSNDDCSNDRNDDYQCILDPMLPDALEDYFVCITECDLNDQNCVTSCLVTHLKIDDGSD